jgi:hypothetical protein
MSVERQFATVSARLLGDDRSVEEGRMLRARGLKTGGKFFAFAARDDLFVKLPAARVKTLIVSGAGRPCELRKGAPMREWVRVTPADEESCAAYVMEARDFVAHQQKS